MINFFQRYENLNFIGGKHEKRFCLKKINIYQFIRSRQTCTNGCVDTHSSTNLRRNSKIFPEFASILRLRSYKSHKSLLLVSLLHD